jgi:hypothetical protein
MKQSFWDTTPQVKVLAVAGVEFYCPVAASGD